LFLPASGSDARTRRASQAIFPSDAKGLAGSPQNTASAGQPVEGLAGIGGTTPMKTSRPPAFATSLLQQLALGDKNEALAGDLIEEFERRRSAAWYWRQVVGGILAGLAGQLRAEWKEAGHVVAWTFGFAVAWNCAMSSYVGIRGLSFCEGGNEWRGDIAQVCGWCQVPAGIGRSDAGHGIVLYLAILRSSDLWRFARGLSVGVMILGLEELGSRTFLPMRGLNLWRIIAFLWTWFSWLPLFVAVLLSMWTARPSWTRSSRRRSRIVA